MLDIKLNLSNADIDRLYIKAGAANLTPAELIENFISDLINDRELANDWYFDCNFNHSGSFLAYLISTDQIDSVLEIEDYFGELKESLKECECDLKSCQDQEEIDDLNFEIKNIKKEIEYNKKQSDYIFKSYTETAQKNHIDVDTFANELSKVLSWNREKNSKKEPTK